MRNVDTDTKTLAESALQSESASENANLVFENDSTIILNQQQPLSTIRPRLLYPAISVDWEFPPPQVDVAGYRTIEQQIEAVTMAGAMHTLNKAIEDGDYDSDLLNANEKDIDMVPRTFNRWSDFSEIRDAQERMKKINEAYNEAQEYARYKAYLAKQEVENARTNAASTSNTGDSSKSRVPATGDVLAK